MGKAWRTYKRGFKCLKTKMCVIILLDGLGYRDRLHLCRGWVREIYGFMLIYADTGDNEDSGLEDIVIFKGLTYL